MTDIPSSAYKEHFSNAHNAAAAHSAANVARRHSADAGDERVRQIVARHLMAKLGYTSDELDFLGEDVLRMQGVKSPFKSAALREGEAVVDLGSGFGPDAFLAAAKVGLTGSVTGINLSAEEVRKATVRARERGLEEGRCSFVEADMEAIPLGAESVDVVISNGGFCLCPDKLAAFKEVHRILKPGGRLAIACTVLWKTLPVLEHKRWPPCMEVFMQRSDIESLLTSLGFDAIQVDEGTSRMDIWDMTDSDIRCVSGELSIPDLGATAGMQMCSHAKKAAEKRAKESVETFLSRDREAGIHWGNPQFDHIKEFDMNELCARVTIYAQKRA